MSSLAAIDVIDFLPGEIEAIVNSDSFFTDVVVAVAERGNLALELERKQAVITAKGGKRGVAVIILQLEGDDTSDGVPYSPMELRPSLQIIENVELNHGVNGTGKSARKIARRLRDTFKLHTPMGLVKNFLCDEPFLIPLPLPEKNLVGYQVNFRCQEDDGETITKAATPTFSRVGDVVTIATATAGASIYYTTDNSHPWADNPEAALYSAPVNVAGVNSLRARAFKDGSFPSNTNLLRNT